MSKKKKLKSDSFNVEISVGIDITPLGIVELYDLKYGETVTKGKCITKIVGYMLDAGAPELDELEVLEKKLQSCIRKIQKRKEEFYNDPSF